jgi:hypothetical protein
MKFQILLVAVIFPMSSGCAMQAVRDLGRTEISARWRSVVIGHDGSIAVLSDFSGDGNRSPAWAVYSRRLVSRLLAEQAPDPNGYCPTLTLNFVSDSGVRYVAAEDGTSAIAKELPIELQSGERIDWDDPVSAPILRYKQHGHEYLLLLNGHASRGAPLLAGVLQSILIVPAWIADLAMAPIYLVIFSDVN